MQRLPSQILLCAVLSAAIPLFARAAQDPTQGPEPPHRQGYKTDAELGALHANVYNGGSDAVRSLPQSAFTVYEDDKPQEISFFEAGDVPVTVGLVIDNSTSMLTQRTLVVAGTNTFAE